MSAKVLSNLDSVGSMIGTLKGIEEGLEEDTYMENLIRQAHGKATNAFNLAAAATATTGRMTHVFEYGTAGITPGTPKFPDPTAANARLWVHTLAGQGGNMDVGYSFRPATQPNPQPTTKSTGVSSKYLQKLSKRKYIFWNRAFVTETGATVEIKAKNGDFLFVPFNNEPARNPLNRKGFVMWNSSKLGPIRAVPGKTSKGEFTSFWMGWWGATGGEIMEQEMRRVVTQDVEIAMSKGSAAANSSTLKPVQTTNIHGSVASSRLAAFNLFKKMKWKRNPNG